MIRSNRTIRGKVFFYWIASKEVSEESTVISANAKRLIGLLLALICLGSVAVGCEEDDCPHQLPSEPECTDCSSETVITESTETTADASGSNAENGGVVVANNGDANIETESVEVESEEGPVVVVTDSLGAEVETEETDVSGIGNNVAEEGSSITSIKEETEVKIEGSEVGAPVVVGDCNYVETEENNVDIKVEDSFNTKNEESEATAEDGSQAGAITGDGSTLVQIGEIEVNENSGNTIDSGNTYTSIYRDDSVTIIDNSVTLIDNSVTTITNIDNSVTQIINNYGGNIDNIKFINVNGVKVEVEANVDGNGDIVINVPVNIGNDGEDDDRKENIKYVVKHETVVVGGVSSVVYAATVHAKKIPTKSELVITEIKDDNGCVKSFEIKANRGPVSLDGVDIEVTDGVRKAGIFMEQLVLAEDERIVVEVETTIMAGTVKVKNSRGVVYAKDDFDLSQVPAGSSFQRLPEEKGVPFHVAPATLDGPNLPLVVNGVAILGATA